MESKNEGFDKINYSYQVDEIRALSSIYEDNFILDSAYSFTIKIKCRPGEEVYLKVSFPDFYPLESPPEYTISAPWMSRQSKKDLIAALEDVYRKNTGKSIIHLWVVTIKDFIAMDEKKSCRKGESKTIDGDAHDKSVETFQLPEIEHGEIITDRKSSFQGHLAKVTSEKQVQLVLAKLKENPKIASAKHNTYAYRIVLPNGSLCEDYDDDGEKKAGAVLLRALQLCQASNTLIIVSRWFGGTLLGSDRFRHYSNAATSLLNRRKLSQQGVSSKNRT